MAAPSVPLTLPVISIPATAPAVTPALTPTVPTPAPAAAPATTGRQSGIFQPTTKNLYGQHWKYGIAGNTNRTTHEVDVDWNALGNRGHLP
ncbi:hypothetical protein CC2G_001957 [Coprinopsis cinerea AmutBmut pab1-1]|nr:hypothetical protein CC2G_001957 [Coprinopsis cinerea AmutBmut pab1-1]